MTTLNDDLSRAAQSGWGRGRVLVAGLWPDIEQALEAGHTRSRIWKTLRDRGEFTLSYPQFVTLVRQRLAAKPVDAVPWAPVQVDMSVPDTRGAADPEAPPVAPPVSRQPGPPLSQSPKPFNPHADLSALI